MFKFDLGRDLPSAPEIVTQIKHHMRQVETAVPAVFVLHGGFVAVHVVAVKHALHDRFPIAAYLQAPGFPYGGRIPGHPITEVSPDSLLRYLTNSHDYFLGFRLPGIRKDLIEVLGHPEDELTKAVIRYFDEYVEEVRKHMEYEDKTVFPYVRSLIQGELDSRFHIDIFRKKHDQVEARLAEFKRILIKYYPARSTNRLNSVLFDIYNCEHDLASHNETEDRLFVPVIMGLEREIKRDA